MKHSSLYEGIYEDVAVREEGWLLMDADGSGIEVQKDDESDRFDTDDDALLFVARQAVQGSPFHALAIFHAMTANLELSKQTETTTT